VARKPSILVLAVFAVSVAYVESPVIVKVAYWLLTSSTKVAAYVSASSVLKVNVEVGPGVLVGSTGDGVCVG
jgi:hypothetical protein